MWTQCEYGAVSRSFLARYFLASPSPLREKKIKALERDVIFFLPPWIFERRPDSWERSAERDVYEKTTLRFFHSPEEFITVQLLPPSPSCRIFSYIVSSSSSSFASFIIPPPRFYRLLIRCLYPKRYTRRARNSSGLMLVETRGRDAH